eukprot:scaffold24089_cov124-Isochrysis_galbana.AAC.3
MLGSKTEDELRARAEAFANELEEAARNEVECAAKMNVFNTLLCDQTGKSPMFTTSDLMRELLHIGAPAKLPNPKCDVPPGIFAARIRESEHAKMAFEVDLISGTVDFASGAHRKAAAELLPPQASSLWSWLFGGRIWLAARCSSVPLLGGRDGDGHGSALCARERAQGMSSISKKKRRREGKCESYVHSRQCRFRWGSGKEGGRLEEHKPNEQARRRQRRERGCAMHNSSPDGGAHRTGFWVNDIGSSEKRPRGLWYWGQQWCMPLPMVACAGDLLSY